jgi:hypothetical protein
MARTSLAVLALVFVLGLAGQAHAQRLYQGTSDNPVGPTVSPYLNLLQNNSFGITNYQSLVRPLVQQGNAINRQGSQLNNLQRQISAPSSGGRGGYGSATGHVTFFMNNSHFYPVPQPPQQR